VTGALVSPLRRHWSRRIARWLLLSVVFLLLAHLSLCAGLYWVMRQTPDFFGRVMMRIPSPIMMVLPFETLWMRARAVRTRSGSHPFVARGLWSSYSVAILDRHFAGRFPRSTSFLIPIATG
jgi:hypothetical protein